MIRLHEGSRKFPIWSYIFLVVHTASILATFLLVRNGESSGHHETGMVWYAFVLIDFPAYIIVYVVYWLDMLLFNEAWCYASENSLLAVSFGVFGGMQWFGLPLFLRWQRRRSIERRRSKRGQCVQCGYSLTGLTERRCPECNKPFDSKLVAAKGQENQICGEEDSP